jgi:methylphosphotriester-DNA--protein-cysteine methyltransferase
MIPNTLTAYERYDTKSAVISARSPFYQLTPIGMGTPFVEHLTNYEVRLATAHCLYPGDLFTQVLWPEYKPSENTTVQRLSAQFRSVNGICNSSNAWIEVLERLTSQTGLRFLTMHTWSPVIAPKQLLRLNRAWCPLCYEEQAKSGAIVYDQLLWALAVVTICPRHQQLLQLQCPHPHCKKPMPVIETRLQPGYCCYCGGWLGAPLDESCSARSSLGDDQFPWHQWVSTTVGDLLAIAPTLSAPPPRERIAQAIEARLQQGPQRSLTALARHLKIEPPQLWVLYQGQHLPRLDTLLALCYRLNIAPVRVLTEDLLVTASLQTGQPVKVPAEHGTNRPRRRFDDDLVRHALEAALAHDSFPPIYPTQLARDLGYNRTRVRDRFPDLWAALVQKCRDAEVAEVARCQGHCNTETVRRQLEAVLAGNEDPPPTMREVALRLGFTQKMLHRFFPALCRAISAKRGQPFDVAQLRQELEAVLASDEDPPPSMLQVAQRLGFPDAVRLYRNLPELSRAISARFESRTGIDGLRTRLEAVLASNEHPAPNMRTVAQRLGYNEHFLRKHFSDLCRAISAAARRRPPMDPIAVQQLLEAALASDARPAPTVNAIARQIGHDASRVRESFADLCQRLSARNQQDLALLEQELTQILANVDETPRSLNAIVIQLRTNLTLLKKQFPEQCRLLVERYQTYRGERRMQRMNIIRDTIRQATIDLHTQGMYPSSYKLTTRMNLGQHLRLPEARQTWRDTLKELGYP